MYLHYVRRKANAPPAYNLQKLASGLISSPVSISDKNGNLKLNHSDTYNDVTLSSNTSPGNNSRNSGK